jgi:hypothetical protein
VDDGLPPHAAASSTGPAAAITATAARASGVNIMLSMPAVLRAGL